MNTRVSAIVETVVRKSSPEKPADAVLRAELKAQRGLPADAGREAARALFTYYRWHGWLSKDQPISAQLDEALALHERFQSTPETFPDDELLQRAIPPWTREVMDVSPAWAKALQSEPRLWLRARRGHGETLSMALGDCLRPFASALPEAVQYRGPMDLFGSPQFHAGDFELQDISSQVVGSVCAPKPGETWWDACAGEGGKMLHLSDLMENKGLIWASDRADWRLKRLKLRAARAKAFNYRAVPWDGGDRPPTKTKFDGVLVDAPCSGVGTWQRNPHARWTTTAADVTELAQIQQRILNTAAASVKPGGRLIYSVCTLTRAETNDIVAAFDTAHPEFQPQPLTNPLQPDAPAGPQLWLWPMNGGSGMFIASWQRAK